MKENILALIVESVEALSEINWKLWKRTTKMVDREATLTELTDIIQFWANAVNALGFTGDDIAKSLQSKWLVNESRIENDY